MKTTAACLLAVFLSLAASAQEKRSDVSGIKNKFLDIPYAKLSHAQMLDIYLPDVGDGPFPVIVAIHGGAWLAGDKRDGQETPMLQGLSRGYAVVSINYRLSSEAQWPAQIQDCKAAVRWIRANAKAYKLDADHIASWGGSAGGHLSAMLGVTGDEKSLEDLALGNPGQSSRVQAAVVWYLPTDFLHMDQQLKESGVSNPFHHSLPQSPEAILFGKVPADAPAVTRSAEPEHFASQDDPPFLIQHGLEDNVVPYQGSVVLARELGKAIGYKKVFLELFPVTGHAGEAFVTGENIQRVFNFLDASMKH